MSSGKINDGGPAFPECRSADTEPGWIRGGMSLRQYAAIKLRVPNSGTDWLDEMIQRSRRDAFAGQALAGELAYQSLENCDADEMAEACYHQADAMLAAREGGQS